MDSSVSKCEAGVVIFVTGTGQNSLVLDNFQVSEAVAVKESNGGTVLGGSVPLGQTWVLGNTAPDGYQAGAIYQTERPAALLSGGKYFVAPLPQYESYDRSQIVSVMGDPEFKVYGDSESTQRSPIFCTSCLTNAPQINTTTAQPSTPFFARMPAAKWSSSPRGSIKRGKPSTSRRAPAS